MTLTLGLTSDKEGLGNSTAPDANSAVYRQSLHCSLVVHYCMVSLHWMTRCQEAQYGPTGCISILFSLHCSLVVHYCMVSLHWMPRCQEAQYGPTGCISILFSLHCSLRLSPTTTCIRSGTLNLEFLSVRKPFSKSL
jgi:hypothetical protein